MYVVLKVQNRNGSQCGYRFFIVFFFIPICFILHNQKCINEEAGICRILSEYLETSRQE